MRQVCAALLAGAMLATPTVSNAQTTDYPTRPIRLVVGFAPGGATDTLARLLTGMLGQELGLPAGLACGCRFSEGIRMIRFVMAVLIALSIGSVREARAVDGNQWMAWGADQQRGYVTATLDTWFNFAAFIDQQREPHTAAETLFHDAVACIKQRQYTYDQIYEAAVSYTKRHADRRQAGMAGVVWNTVSEMCD